MRRIVGPPEFILCVAKPCPILSLAGASVLPRTGSANSYEYCHVKHPTQLWRVPQRSDIRGVCSSPVLHEAWTSLCEFIEWIRSNFDVQWHGDTIQTLKDAALTLENIGLVFGQAFINDDPSEPAGSSLC
eukprot:s552_g30.t1